MGVRGSRRARMAVMDAVVGDRRWPATGGGRQQAVAGNRRWPANRLWSDLALWSVLATRRRKRLHKARTLHKPLPNGRPRGHRERRRSPCQGSHGKHVAPLSGLTITERMTVRCGRQVNHRTTLVRDRCCGAPGDVERASVPGGVSRRRCAASGPSATCRPWWSSEWRSSESRSLPTWVRRRLGRRRVGRRRPGRRGLRRRLYRGRLRRRRPDRRGLRFFFFFFFF